ncbi:MAG: acyloxyacyl hydrolase [Flavobacteriales bacterium]|nr:acyloxyacyl hydrolase [Flavobacteriales bacterium]
MKSLLTACILCVALLAKGQQDTWLEVRYSPGAFIPHRLSLPQLRTGPAKTLSISYSRGLDGTMDWHHYYRGGHRGLSLFVMDTGNRDEMGYFLSLYPYLDLPITANERSGLEWHMGVGLAYLTEHYDFEENFYNKAIGGHINYSIVMALRYRIERGNWRAATGLSMSHASNAAIRLPNLGVNFVSLDMVLAYRIAQGEKVEWDMDRPWSTSKDLHLLASVGMREANSFTHEIFGVQEIRLRYQKRFSSRMAWSLGTDFIHNQAGYQELDDDLEVDFGLDVLQWGLHGGIALVFDKACLYFNNGLYLVEGYQGQGPLYHRFGGYLQISDRWMVDLSLKTHFAKADYLALGLGYSIASKKIKDHGGSGDQ